MRRLLPIAALASLTAIGLLMLVPPLLGYERYVIEGGSMGSALPRGSIAYEEVVKTSEIAKGDVITYRPPPGSGPAGLVTHRIAQVRHVASRPVFRTRGDANPVADPWTFTLPGPKQARVVAGVPYVGYLLAALSDRRVRMLVVGVPALLIAVSALAGLWREAGAETARSTA